jgi:hypothetical protein
MTSTHAVREVMDFAICFQVQELAVMINVSLILLASRVLHYVFPGAWQTWYLQQHSSTISTV